jgi:uncharacterized protein
MSPHEVMVAGGAVEHFNAEAGARRLTRTAETYPRAIWLNPVPRSARRYTQSIGLIQRLMNGRMYPLTLEGIEKGAQELVR